MDPLAPPPSRVSSATIVAPDVTSVEVRLRLDVASRRATAFAAVTFDMDGPAGRPALDLRQRVAALRLDGVQLPEAAFPHVDMGGGPGAEVRALDRTLQPGGHHRLEVDYNLDTPAATGAEPVGWEDAGVRFDLWMSDLEPGRYLEMWAPAPLVHDRFALTVEVEVAGTSRQHSVVTNAADETVLSPNHWRLRYPPTFTALSPMLVVSPSDSVEQRRSLLSLPGRRTPFGLRLVRHREVDADLASCAADVGAWLAYLSARYGPWAHGPGFCGLLWAPARGMEYDGAATSTVEALEHEVFHSWFGRGVKPARASDGWIDEAYTSWATSSPRAARPRFASEPLDPGAPPVVLYPPHPWSRHTPRESYGKGAALFAAVADTVGGPERLRSAMAAWYVANAGGLVTTDGLLAHLQQWSGADLRSLWERFVHGRP